MQQSRGAHKIGQIWHRDHSSICFQGEFEKGQKLLFSCHSHYSIAPYLIFNASDHLRHCSQSHDTAIVASPEEGMKSNKFFLLIEISDHRPFFPHHYDYAQDYAEQLLFPIEERCGKRRMVMVVCFFTWGSVSSPSSLRNTPHHQHHHHHLHHPPSSSLV